MGHRPGKEMGDIVLLYTMSVIYFSGVAVRHHGY